MLTVKLKGRSPTFCWILGFWANGRNLRAEIEWWHLGAGNHLIVGLKREGSRQFKSLVRRIQRQHIRGRNWCLISIVVLRYLLVTGKILVANSLRPTNP